MTKSPTPGASSRTEAASSRAEAAAWMAIVALMITLYAWGSFISRADAFGIDALRPFGPLPSAAALALALVVAAAIALFGVRVPIERPIVAAIASAVSLPILFLFRTNFLNPDGNAFTPKFETDVPLFGAHMTHDEMLELFVHSRFWYYTHRWWGWSVVHSYQVVSCLAGALFVYAIVRVARRLAPMAPWLFVAGMLAGGYMQLFFGDVENYTVTAALVTLYVLAACRFLAGEVRLLVPTLTLAVAACFHLEAGWLGLSLVFLFVVSHRRTADWGQAASSAAAAAGIVLGTALYFHFHGLPLRRFFSSHAGNALRLNGVFAVGMPVTYYLQQMNLLLLLCPGALMLIPLFVWHRHDLDDEGRFLAIGAASMLLFQAIWKAQLGVYNDWNLYGIGGLVVSLLVWRAISSSARSFQLRAAAVTLAVTCGLHTYAWIATNHAFGR